MSPKPVEREISRPADYTGNPTRRGRKAAIESRGSSRLSGSNRPFQGLSEIERISLQAHFEKAPIIWAHRVRKLLDFLSDILPGYGARIVQSVFYNDKKVSSYREPDLIKSINYFMVFGTKG